MIEIDKNIPVPEAARRGRPPKYPLAKMEVGDSFFLKTTGDPKKDQNRQSTLRTRARGMGILLSIRSGEGGHRVWRVAPEAP